MSVEVLWASVFARARTRTRERCGEGATRTFLPISDSWPDAMKRPHFESASAVMLPVCPVRKDCEPSTSDFIITVEPSAYTRCVPFACHCSPPRTLPARAGKGKRR